MKVKKEEKEKKTNTKTIFWFNQQNCTAQFPNQHSIHEILNSQNLSNKNAKHKHTHLIVNTQINESKEKTHTRTIALKFNHRFESYLL